MKNYILIGNPWITSYWFYTDLQLITNEVDPEHLYFLNNFIDLHSSGGAFFEMYFSYELINYQMRMFTHCPFLKSLIIDKSVPVDEEFIKDAVNHGWYLICYVNRSYLKERNGSTGEHQIMIYGYDDAEQKLYYCDHNPYGRFRTDFSCSYEAFNDAYQSINRSVFTEKREKSENGSDFLNNVFLFHPQSCREYQLDLAQVLQSFKIYLNLEQGEYEKTAHDGHYYGMQIYEHMEQYFNGLSDGTSVFSNHLGSYAVLYDHKIILMELLQKLCRMRLIDNDLRERYQEVVDNTLILRNMMLKYTMSRNERLIPRLCGIAGEIKKLERELLGEVICVLERKLSEGGGNPLSQ